VCRCCKGEIYFLNADVNQLLVVIKKLHTLYATPWSSAFSSNQRHLLATCIVRCGILAAAKATFTAEEISKMRVPGRRGRRPVQGTIPTKYFVDVLLSRLPSQQQSVIAARYGLWSESCETLQRIGDRLGVTRERVRQIESDGLRNLRDLSPESAITRMIAGTLRRRTPPFLRRAHGIFTENEIRSVLGDDCTSE
jgi:hypothetical protein